MKSVAFAFGGMILIAGIAIPAQPQKAAQSGRNLSKSSKKISYAREVAPILKASCYSCHGTDSPKAGLNLATPSALIKSSSLLKGKGAESNLIHRMKGLDGMSQMPLGFQPLSSQQIATIEQWINEGAIIDQDTTKHWSYVAPSNPKIPSIKKWGKNPVDAFVFEKMLQQGYKPSPSASKETLIRRVYLDLIGIPPTVEEVRAFVADKSTNSFEKVVDRLLANPHYGERQARIWLDLARYADTNGYEADASRTAFVFRDWVIEAFNSNMGFDQFTIKQLAGDMLANATTQDKVATGFHRNTMHNLEGGVNPAESQFNTVIDRVATTSSVWLGSTLQCARCHDHKYDPFSQKDFYKMFAVFNNTTYNVVGDYTKSYSEVWNEPTMKVLPTRLQLQRDAEARKIANEYNSTVQIAKNSTLSGLQQPTKYTTVKFSSLNTQSKIPLIQAENGTITYNGALADTDVYQLSTSLANPIFGFKIDTSPVLDSAGKVISENFLITSLKAKIDGKEVVIQDISADFTQSGYDPFELIFGNKESGWAIYPEKTKNHTLYATFGKPITGQSLELELRFESVWKKHVLRQFSVSTTENPNFMFDSIRSRYQFETLPNGNIQGKLIGTSNIANYFSSDQSSARKSGQEDDLFATIGGFSEKYGQLRRRARELKKFDSQAVTALVITEKPGNKVLTAPVYHRGEFASPTAPVPAGIPSLFGKLSENGNRLSVAKWIVNKQNPLTARVQVNRIWEQYFGRGIVESVEDFGTQGSKPSHQKLLDWLACEFMDKGWDMKHIHKLIVTSATYQQSSAASENLLARDPLNTYLARGPRFRLEAEMIRDSALAISGLLNPKIGGPSVMPYQPAGVWDSPYNGEQWMEAKNGDRYRRGIYVFAKRTAMYPSFMALDAGTRESCLARRTRTNTPLQALTLMNDKSFLEAAVALGAKIKQKGIGFGFESATCRKPSQEELKVLNSTFNKILSRYKANPTEAKKLGPTPEDAAYAMVGNVILNLDEVITKS
jgi:hypothetical protein